MNGSNKTLSLIDSFSHDSDSESHFKWKTFKLFFIFQLIALSLYYQQPTKLSFHFAHFM